MTTADPERDSRNGVVVVSLDGPVAWVTLNRPARRNALDRAAVGELLAALSAVIEDEAVGVIVLRGADDTFCSGDDLYEAGTLDPAEFRAHIESLQAVTRLLRAAPQPVVASIAGSALGAGLELALGCDLKIAADTATFGCPEVRWGLTITNGSSVLLATAIGETRARDLVLLGRSIDAVTAQRYGLVTSVVRADELASATREAVADLLSAAPEAIALAKQLLTDDEIIDEALRREVDAACAAFATQAARTRIAQFATRRVRDKNCEEN